MDDFRVNGKTLYLYYNNINVEINELKHFLSNKIFKFGMKCLLISIKKNVIETLIFLEDKFNTYQKIFFNFNKLECQFKCVKTLRVR